MVPEFSEFSYGFALTRELCERAWGDLEVAPVFPSLVEEGRQGHDVHLDMPGNPIFIQFKRAEYMVRPTAMEWDLFNAPYYRFWLHAPRHSDQHELLLERDQNPNLVYYAAPSTHRVTDLNRAFMSRTVVDESVFFRPRDIGVLPDANAHCIAFQPGAHFGYRCSEPEEISVHSVGAAVLEKLAAELQEMDPVPDPRLYFAELAERLLNAAQARSEFAQARVRLPELIPDPIRRAAYLSRTVLGAEVLWAVRPRGDA